MSSLKLKGGCLCGSITYEVDGDPMMTAICHCKDCQKQTGTTFSLVIGVSPDKVKVDGKPAIYTTMGETGTEVFRHFCGSCGSPILSDATGSFGVYFIKAGTLEDTSFLKPELEIFCDEAQNWCNLNGNWAKSARNPTTS